MAGGYVGGFTAGLMLSGGDFAAANQAGLSGMKSGVIVGGASGAVGGYLQGRTARAEVGKSELNTRFVTTKESVTTRATALKYEII
ncbi:MAG: hypothetical protein ACK5L5_05515 [Bacteroidales bacterium]